MVDFQASTCTAPLLIPPNAEKFDARKLNGQYNEALNGVRYYETGVKVKVC